MGKSSQISFSFFLNKRQINYCYLHNNVSVPFPPVLNYLAREAKTGFKNHLYEEIT